MSAIQKAIALCGGNVTELARRCNVKYQTVQYWRKSGAARPRYWQAIVKATDGQVTQAELLADVTK